MDGEEGKGEKWKKWEDRRNRMRFRRAVIAALDAVLLIAGLSKNLPTTTTLGIKGFGV